MPAIRHPCVRSRDRRARSSALVCEPGSTRDDGAAGRSGPPGTTGRPKDVLLSRPALRASATATLRRLGGPGSWLLALPVHYVAGPAGRGAVGRRRRRVAGRARRAPRPAGAAAALDHGRALRRRRCRPSCIGGCADAADVAALQALRRDPARRRAGRRPTCSTGPGTRGVNVVTTYGMSETVRRLRLRRLSARRRRRSRSAPTARIRISGPVLFDGYAGDPELTAEVLRDGWLHDARPRRARRTTATCACSAGPTTW